MVRTARNLRESDEKVDPVIAKVRKLLRLAESPNPHEAASARQNADELMAKHGLTEDDISEDVFEVIENTHPNASHSSLAQILATSRGCSLVANKQGSLAFCGRKKVVEALSNLYKSLINEADRLSQMSYVGNPPMAAREAWKLCWWMGFLTAITKRLQPSKEQLPPEVINKMVSRDTAPREVSIALEAFDELAKHIQNDVVDVDTVLKRLRSSAYSAGRMIGEHISLDQSVFKALSAGR